MRQKFTLARPVTLVMASKYLVLLRLHPPELNIVPSNLCLAFPLESVRNSFVSTIPTSDPSSTALPLKKTANGAAASQCARPDCQANTAPDANLFEVEAIVGMSGSGTSALYLVKWKG